LQDKQLQELTEEVMALRHELYVLHQSNKYYVELLARKNEEILRQMNMETERQSSE
jgi:hypothetical protein